MKRLLLALAALASATAARADWKADARELYAQAIAIPTVAGRDKVGDLARLLAARYRAAGWAEGDVVIRPYEKTHALIVRWRAPKSRAKAVMLMAHMDVVEARRDDWSIEPFVLNEKDGYFYGRGTADDKQGVVGITSALLRLKASGWTPRRDIIVLFTGDEETDGKGAELAAKEWPETKDVAYVLNGDVGGGQRSSDGTLTHYEIQAAEKSYMTFTFTVRNRGGHSSQPRPDNAIYQLGDALAKLRTHRFAPSLNPVTRRYFELRAAMRGPLAGAIAAYLANPLDAAAADAIDADESERGVTRTTCVATRLEGGHADNALPALARATVNCRVLPGIKADAVKVELVAAIADPDVVIEPTAVYDSGPASALDPSVTSSVARAINAVHPGVPLLPIMSRGATDATYFRVAGIPVYGVNFVWYLVPDDFREHGRDERIAVAAFYENAEIWHSLIADLASR